jgi:gamma-glutamylcyclotransferase (GGCT)/AIG2-like uncharacterized protein YtfP
MSGQFYFAYGSNLNVGDWENWCRKHGFGAGLLRFRSIGYLPDRDIAFSYRSTSRNGGVLDIEPRAGQIVRGVIFEVSDEAWRALDQKEGAPIVYERVPAIALDESGEEVPVMTYRVACRRQRFVQPTPEYVEIVRTGLEHHGLASCGLLAAANNQTTPYVTDAFFCYGTLMRGESRFGLLRSFGPKCILLAKTFGRLIDLGSFPGLVDQACSDQLVEGEFVRVADVAEATETLDRVEGFRGYGVAGSLYRRTLVGVDVGDGRIRQAWTYGYAASYDSESEIASGDWRAYTGCRNSFLRKVVAAHTGGDEDRVACEIAGQIPFSFGENREAVVARLLPLDASLGRGELSERRLAQFSGKWAVVP